MTDLSCAFLWYSVPVVRGEVFWYIIWWLNCVVNGCLAVPTCDLFEVSKFTDMKWDTFHSILSWCVHIVVCHWLQATLGANGVDVVALFVKGSVWVLCSFRQFLCVVFVSTTHCNFALSLDS